MIKHLVESNNRSPKHEPVTSQGERAGYALSGLIVVFWGLRVWTGGSLTPAYEPLSILLIVTGLAITLLSWYGIVSRKLTLVIVLAAATLGFGLWVHALTMTSPGYGTDEIAFDQYAAELLLRGINPYTHNLSAAYQKFLVPPTYYTYTISGHVIDRLSYPSLSFLLYVPLLLLGIHTQAGVYVDCLFWVLTAGSLAIVLPWRWKWLAVVFLSFTQYDAYILGGVTDSLFLPFLIIAVWRWDRFDVKQEKSVAMWIGPVMLGIAMAVKQTPWFIAPFLLAGVSIESKYRGQNPWWTTSVKYFLMACLPFLLLNLPFIVWNPKAWLHGILLPLASSTLPAGQGLVGLWLFNHIGSGNMSALSHAADVATLGLFALFVFTYPSFKRGAVALVPILFIWPTRSFASYLIDLFPAIIVASLTVQGTQGPSAVLTTLYRKGNAWARRGMFVFLTLCSMGFVAFLSQSMLGKQPLAIQIVGVQTSGQYGTVSGLRLRVRNRTDRALTPHFTVMLGGYQSSFWLTPQGPTRVPPKSSKTITLDAPNTDSMPSITGGFAVDAFVTNPSRFSDTPMYLPPTDQTVVLPFAVNHVVPLGRSIDLTVQVRNRLGRPIHRAGIIVALGQVIYAEKGMVYAESQINGYPEGQTPVTERTNSNGIAVFNIKDLQSQPYPIYYQAYIASHGYPHGYSNVVSIRFG